MNPIEYICKNKLYVVVRLNDQQKVYDVTNALIRAGIKVFEIPFLNENSVEVLKKLKKENPKLLFAAGGIITARQAKLALNANADVLACPVFQMHLVKFSQSNAIPIIIGASTANEAYEAWKTRVPLIKIYPTKPLGGVEYIEDLLRPMSFLNIMATGGIKVDNFIKYLQAGASCVGIGRDFYQNLSLKQIEDKAKNAVNELENFLKK